MNINSNIWIYLNNDWIEAVVINDKIHLQLYNQEFDLYENKIFNYNDYITCYRNNSIHKINNLTNLIHLNEPSILETLLDRYNKDKIYTLNSNILISINPYKNLDIYGDNIIDKYKNEKCLEPHIFNTIKLAYNNLIKNKKNQSILVSGLSGSGKTYACKLMMKYLAVISDRKLMNSIENKILLSNIILESFGNSKTIRNNNSSRFGKYIKILFDHNFQLVGAQIETCLLETIRVIYQSKSERNFHIFYQILYGLSPQKLKKIQFN